MIDTTQDPQTELDEAKKEKDPAKEVEYWLKQLRYCQRRERKFRQKAREAVEIYEADNADANPFNILHSNVETMLPGLYSKTPRPIVSRRYRDPDPLGKHVAAVLERLLSYFLDPASNAHASFDEVCEQVVVQAAVPGRGVTWIEPVEGKGIEAIRPKLVQWDGFFMGYAKVWEEVPWIADRAYMDRGELVEEFGEEIGNAVQLNCVLSEYGAKDESESVSEEGMKQEDKGRLLAEVYRVWVKKGRKIIFVSPGYEDGFLRETEDPYNLKDFFPAPKPLALFTRLDSLIPQTPYETYRNQAQELNRVTKRIDKIIAALKIRGAYDATVAGLDAILTAEDNVLVPIENFQAYRAMGAGNTTLESALFIVPIEKLVSVLQQLYLQREQVKQVIYEITGLADIVRGASKASETLGAQEIKSQWGSLRMQRVRKRVEAYVRDNLRIMAEMAINTMTLEQVKKIVGLYYPSQEEKAQAQMELQMLQMQQPVPGQPAPAPQSGRSVEDLQGLLSTPTWEDLWKLLKDGEMLNYHIDIETNSTVLINATEEKQAIGEFMNAVSQFFNGVGPLVQEGIFPFEAAKAMLLVICRKYEFGVEVESYIEQMTPPQPKADPKVEAAQLKMQQDQQAFAADMEMKKLDFALEQQKARNELEKMKMEMQQAQQDFAMETRKMLAEIALAQRQNEIKAEQLAMQAQAQREKLNFQRQSQQMKADQQRKQGQKSPKQ